MIVDSEFRPDINLDRHPKGDLMGVSGEHEANFRELKCSNHT
jgi:hypothetical protein